MFLAQIKRIFGNEALIKQVFIGLFVEYLEYTSRFIFYRQNLCNFVSVLVELSVRASAIGKRLKSKTLLFLLFPSEQATDLSVMFT